MLSSHLKYRLGIGKSGIEDALSCLSLLQFVHSNYLSHGFIMLKSLQAGATHNCWTNSWSNGSEGIHLKWFLAYSSGIHSSEFSMKTDRGSSLMHSWLVWLKQYSPLVPAFFVFLLFKNKCKSWVEGCSWLYIYN